MVDRFSILSIHLNHRCFLWLTSPVVWNMPLCADSQCPGDGLWPDPLVRVSACFPLNNLTSLTFWKGRHQCITITKKDCRWNSPDSGQFRIPECFDATCRRLQAKVRRIQEVSLWLYFFLVFSIWYDFMGCLLELSYQEDQSVQRCWNHQRVTPTTKSFYRKGNISGYLIGFQLQPLISAPLVQ